MDFWCVLLQELAEGKVRTKKKEAPADFTSDRDDKLSTQVSEYNVSQYS